MWVIKRTQKSYLIYYTKTFTIAGPVIVYGTVASVIYGVVYWITTIL